MAVVLALGAAVLFGAGVTLQQRAATAVPRRYALRLGLLGRLLARPMWLLGMASEIGGFALQAAALDRGSLVVVQPIMTLDVLATLVVIAAWAHQPLRAREWCAAATITLGVAIFLVLAGPHQHSRSVASPGAWLGCGLVVGALVGLGAGTAVSRSTRTRALGLAAAAGVANGFTAVLTKAFVGRLDEGVGAMFRSWEPYALVVVGIATLVVSQSAYQDNHPTLVLPIMNVGDPLVGVVLGLVLFGEHVSLVSARPLLLLVSVATTVAGVVALTRAPLVLEAETAAVPARLAT